MRLALGRIAEFISAVGEFDDAAVAGGYSIDSRTLAPGELFFAVKGERLDGHEFVEQALAAGAVGVVVGRDQAARYSGHHRLLAVADPLAALQRLGTAVRRLWGKKLIAVTGSTGKTTTKEAIAQVLRPRFRVLKSEGNLNNHFGLPLQLLRLEPEHEIAVIEIGMNHAGEIRALAEIAHHDVAVVTNVGPVHLEFFESVAAIARSKYELIETLHAGGTAVLNADDEYVSQFGRDFHGKVVTFGIERPADVRAENIQERGLEGSAFDLLAGGCRQSVTLPLLGLHNVYNALAAAAVGVEVGIAPSEAAEALAALLPQDKRGELTQVAGATVINDCYNSNPKALAAMVASFARLPARRRIVVAGEMLELGATAPELHRQCGTAIAQSGIDVLLGVHGAARQMVEGALAAGMAAEFVETPQQAGEWLAREVRPGDAVLLKASRGVKLEGALEAWRARLQAAAAK
ncbi:MAG: UDP-N-acetylmuramoyl-tripeptide--D-alanyl-D-alanine ligase [Terriglobales bacterium]